MNNVNSVEKTSKGKGFVVTAWIMFAIALPTLIVPPIGQMLWLILLIMLGMDASKVNVKVLKKSSLELSNTDRWGVVEWVGMGIFFWIIVIPLYLIKRNRLADAACRTVNENLYMSDEELSQRKKGAGNKSIIYALIVLSLLIALGGGCYLYVHV